jgi:hypothetical protein
MKEEKERKNERQKHFWDSSYENRLVYELSFL